MRDPARGAGHSHGLQVIAELPPDAEARIAACHARTRFEVRCAESPCTLDVLLRGHAREHSAAVRIANHHANIVYVEKDGRPLKEVPVATSTDDRLTDRSCLNVRDILDFADSAPVETLAELLDGQIELNAAIAEEGLRGSWGAQIGRILLEDYDGGDIKLEAKAYAAAGSDARMSGCEMPVTILSGSGNQGITASLPVIRYAKRLHASKEQLYRALAVSDLVTIHQKNGNRAAVGLLRRGVRRRGRGRGNLLPVRR